METNEEKGLQPDSNGEKSGNPSTSIVQPDATLTQEQVKLFPVGFDLFSYAKIVEPIARDVEVYTKIPYLIPIAQSAHESRNGNSGLARNHCNLFGITATDSWKKAGKMIALMPTFEYVNGHRVDMNREFRAYKSWRDSFFDWAKILTELSVYKKALALLRDPATMAAGITEMGKVYATDPAYAKKLLETYIQLAKGNK